MTGLLAILLMAGQLAAVPEPATDQVEIVLFSDFQCPFCAQFSKPFHELEAHGLEGVRTAVEFRNFPLEMHTNAPAAHRAAMAAAEQGKFWEMHDLLFAHQTALKPDDLLDYAKRLSLDIDRFRKDMDSNSVKEAIAADIAEGTRRGINATPTFYVNGKQFIGTRSLEQLTKLVRDERWRHEALSQITDDLMSLGPADASVTVEMFADLTSPVTRPAIAVLKTMMDRSSSSVRLQFRNFPLVFHPQASLAHEAAMSAAKHGRFWELADYLLDHQDRLREQDLIAFAGRIGLDPEAFLESIQQHRYAPRVDSDLELAGRRGVRGSPVIFVNGKRIDGVPSLQALEAYVQNELFALETQPRKP